MGIMNFLQSINDILRGICPLFIFGGLAMTNWPKSTEKIKLIGLILIVIGVILLILGGIGLISSNLS